MQVRVVSAFEAGTGGAGDGPDRPRLDLVQFSRFKHGAVAPAWRFAGELVDRLAMECPDTPLAPRLVVTASCYKYVPLASVALARASAHLLNRRRAAAGVPPVTTTQLYRAQLIEGDYSTMSLHQRHSFIETDVIRVDTEVLAGAAVLVVDDLRITGFHEGRIAAVLAEAGVPAATFGYCAVLDARDDPTIEKRLNQTSIGDVESLVRLIEAGDFVLNSRVCKLILAAAPHELADLVRRIPLTTLRALVAGMECNGYGVMARYRPAYELMVATLGTRSAASGCSEAEPAVKRPDPSGTRSAASGCSEAEPAVKRPDPGGTTTLQGVR